MCGICGFISKRALTLNQLKVMNDTMHHRDRVRESYCEGS